MAATGCSGDNQPQGSTATSDRASTTQIRERPPRNPDKNAYFGDLHVHPANAFDA
jgi:hypothetical protein